MSCRVRLALSAIVAPCALACTIAVRQAAAQGPPPPPPPPQGAQSTTLHGTPTATIDGRVVDDRGNGVAGIVVTLRINAPNTAYGFSQVLVMTGADGRFVCTAVPAGSYAIFGGGANTTVTVHDGEHIRDLALTTRPRGGDISGTITDESGEPLAGVGVSVFGRFRYPAMTDDRGTYHVSVEPGRYRVGVASTPTTVPIAVLRESQQSRSDLPSGLFGPLWSDATDIVADVFPHPPTPPPSSSDDIEVYPTTYYPDSTTATDAAVLSIGFGENRAGVDIRLHPVRAARISGRVISPTGPVPYPGLFLDVDDVQSAHVTTASAAGDGDGSFVLLGVAPGTYTLSVKGSPVAQGLTSGQAKPVFGSRTITVGRADTVNDVDVIVGPGASISGRIVFDGSTARPTPEQLAARPFVLLMGHKWYTGPRNEANGRFSLPNVPPGRYEFVGLGGPSWLLASAEIDGRDVYLAGLDVGADDISNLVITFTDHPSHLSGVVRSAAGTPDDRATVAVFPANRSSWTWPTDVQFRSVQTAHDGTYSLVNLPAGTYFVVAVSKDSGLDWTDPADLNAASQVATRVDITASTTQTLDLKTSVVK